MKVAMLAALAGGALVVLIAIGRRRTRIETAPLGADDAREAAASLTPTQAIRAGLHAIATGRTVPQTIVTVAIEEPR